jgi:hypothetical protein
MKWKNSPAAPDSSARRRPAPAGYGEDTIRSRREDIETGSARSLIQARVEATMTAIHDQYDQIDTTIDAMHKLGNPHSTAHLRTELRGASPIIAVLMLGCVLRPPAVGEHCSRFPSRFHSRYRISIGVSLTSPEKVHDNPT